MDRGRLRPANDVERHRLVGLTAKVFDFEIGTAAVEGVTEGRADSWKANIRWLQATQAR
jgi:hypothetical protein